MLHARLHRRTQSSRTTGRVLSVLLLALSVQASSTEAYAAESNEVVAAAATKGKQARTTISLKEYIELVTANDSVFEEILLDSLPLRYQKELRLPARDILLDVQHQHFLNLDRGRTGQDTGLQLSKLFPMQGTAVGVQYARTESTTEGTKRSQLQFSIAQPIAENAFGRNTQLLDRIVGIETEVARHQIIEAYEDYFATVVTAYIIWHEAAQNLEIAESSYRSNTQLLEDIRAREKKQIALPIDVNKIRLQVLAKEETLRQYQEDYDVAYDIILRSIRVDKDTPYYPSAPHAYDSIPSVFAEEWKKTKKAARTFRILRLLERSTSIRVEKEADDLLPSVALTSSYQIRGNDYDFGDKENTIFAGISVSLPFSDQVQEAEHQVAIIAARKQGVITKNTYFDIEANLKNLYTQMHSQQRLLTIAEKKIELAKAVLRDEAENYSFGKVDLNDYIQAVNVVDNNRFASVARLARMQRQYIEWLRLSDQLVTKKQITATAIGGGFRGDIALD